MKKDLSKLSADELREALKAEQEKSDRLQRDSEQRDERESQERRDRQAREDRARADAECEHCRYTTRVHKALKTKSADK